MSAPSAGLLDDASLVRQAQGGDREAFAQLYDRYFERVYDFVRRTLRNEADAADVTQEVFIKAMGSLGTLSNPAVFKSWLFTVARNLSISRIRAGRDVLSLDYAEAGAEEGTLADLLPDADVGGSPEESAERAEMAAMVWAVAAGLDRRQYTVLDLSVRQELDASEMAEALGVTRNNAYVLINRTKAAFSESATDYMLYQDGQRNCPLLQGELQRAGINAYSAGARKVIERHLKQCPRCAEKKKRLPVPLAMFGGLALAAPPEGLRERIRSGLLETEVGAAPPPGLGGAAGGGGGGSVRRIALLAAGALGAMLLALLAGLGTLALIGDDEDSGAPVADPDREVSPTATTGGSSGSLPTPTPTPASTPSPTVANLPSPSVTAGSGGSPIPAPTSAATAVPTTPAATPSATSTSTSTPSPTATSTITPTATATATSTPSPTASPSPTATPTVAPLAFLNVSYCWVSPNGNLRVTVTMGNVNGQALSGTVNYATKSGSFSFVQSTGTAIVVLVPITTGQTASIHVETATRQANTTLPVTSSALCS